jgi:hypothetical protein
VLYRCFVVSQHVENLVVDREQWIETILRPVEMEGREQGLDFRAKRKYEASWQVITKQGGDGR